MKKDVTLDSMEIDPDPSPCQPKDVSLNQLQAWYRAVFHQSRELVYLIDIETLTLISANPAFCRVTGYDESEIVGLSVLEFVAHDLSNIRTNTEACLTRGEVALGIRRLKRKDGHIRFVDAHISRVEYGDRPACCVVAQDVTERIRFERQIEINASWLERQNRQLALLQAINRAISANLSLPDLLATLGRELQPWLAVDAITIVRQTGSEAAIVEANWPETAATVVGTTLGFVGPDGDRLMQLDQPTVLLGSIIDAIGEHYPTFLEDGIQSLLLAPLFVREERYGLLALSSVRERAFGPDATVLLSLIGPQINVALANIAAVRSLEDVARLKSEFVAVASHELRTPVSVAVGYAKMLASPDFPVTDDERRTYLTRLADACERLSTLVEDLLDLSRIEDGKLRLELEPVEVQDAIDEIHPLLLARYSDRPALRIEGDAVLMADRAALERVVLNLLDNAFKYGPATEGPRVRIRTTDTPGTVRVEVFNRGALSAEEQARLFARFSRLPRHLGVPGTGIGLFASKAVIDQMGGEMGVESRDGEVVFWFELPSQISEPKPA